MSPTPTGQKPILKRIVLGLVALVLGLFVLAVVLLDIKRVLDPELPPPNPVANDAGEPARDPDLSRVKSRFVKLPQNWANQGSGLGSRQWFHHVDQGTTIMPYRWLIALQQPEVRILSKTGLFLDSDYMSRFGFLPSEADPELNPDGRLPIGWAIHRNFSDPTAPTDDDEAYNARPYDAVGLTCAACHTGRLTYERPDGRRVDLLIEGGSAMIELRKLQHALGTAVFYTLYVPGRFDRFADQVLEDGSTSAERRQLRAKVMNWFKEAKSALDRDEKLHVNQLESGFARTDALSLIGNRVFGLLDPGNIVTAGAPVNFPHLWDTSWFDWVQYNGSIRMVMVRNIGEALGVGARTNLDPGDPRLMESTVNVANLHRIEDQLGGPVPFSGLTAPKWEDAVRLSGFPPLNDELMKQGKRLYDQNCLHCHGPSAAELKEAHEDHDTRYWVETAGVGPAAKGLWLLKTPLIPLSVIGTDPAQAVDFAFRFAKVPDPSPKDTRAALEATNDAPPETPGLITATAAKGLRFLTEEIRERAYKAANLSPDERAEWDRYRKDERGMPDDEVIIANLMYKARPLDGIWATPPFLHNGSVPTLEALLSPVALRPKKPLIGSTLYDPERVGYKDDGKPGRFELDTSLSGNYNTGHEFRDLTLLELELHYKIFDEKPGTSIGAHWAKLMKITPEQYAKLSEPERRERRRELTRDALYPKSVNGETQSINAHARGAEFFGVIGPGLDPDERRAIIEYVKSL